MFSGQKQAVTLMPENPSPPHVSQTLDPTPSPGSVEMPFPAGDLRAQHTLASEVLLPPAPRPAPPPPKADSASWQDASAEETSTEGQ